MNDEIKKCDILYNLYEMILDRKANPKQGSYTNYLLDEGVDKICKKVGEEATETVIAAKNKELPNFKDELVGEMCDLVYHIEVLMVDRGVSMEDVKSKLEERHKKECNKKKFNTRGEY